ASFAPFAAGRSRADSSPVRANPPPILIVPPAAGLPPAPAEGCSLLPPPAGVPVGVLQAAIRKMVVTMARLVRVIGSPPITGLEHRCRARDQPRTATVSRWISR